MNKDDIEQVKRMIEKDKENSWGGVILAVFVFLFVSFVLIPPLFSEVIIPYWFRVTGWEWLAK